MDVFGDVVVDVVARLGVEARWKGDSRDLVEVSSRFTTLCEHGAPFYAGEEYLVWAYDSADEPGVLYAGFCTRTALLEHAAEDLEFLGGPRRRTAAAKSVRHQ